MTERLVDFEQRLKNSRQRLEALADRAARLRTRLEAEGALASSMERLANEARRAAPGGEPRAGDPAQRDYREDDGFFLAEGWEIALINEEGK
jgi:septal ring factor EnvC (AmiA/AmiB activator)